MPVQLDFHFHLGLDRLGRPHLSAYIPPTAIPDRQCAFPRGGHPGLFSAD